MRRSSHGDGRSGREQRESLDPAGRRPSGRVDRRSAEPPGPERERQWAAAREGRSDAPSQRGEMPAPAARRWRRRFGPRSRGQGVALAAIIILAVLCMAFLLTVEWVRRSPQLRDRVIGEVVRLTGLPAEAGDVHVSWNGQTTIQDLTLHLPIDGEQVLRTPAMTIQHRSILSVILAREVDITAIDIADAELFAQERDAAEGGWTVVEAIERLAAHIRGRSGDGDGAGDPPDVPAITARSARLVVIPAEGERFAAPLEVVCEPGHLRYTIDVHLEQSRARLTLALGGDWRHGLDAELAPSRPLWAAMADAAGLAVAEGASAPPVSAGRWRGRRSASGLTGELRIDSARLGDIAAEGVVRVEQIDGGARVDVQELFVQRGGQYARVLGGRLRVVPPQIEVQRAQFSAGVGEEPVVGGALEGSLDLNRRAGEVVARFFGGWPAGRIEHAGTLTAEVTSLGGFPEVRATIDAGGRAGDVELDIDAALVATGRAWDDMQGRLHITSLEGRQGGRTWDAGELQLEALLYDRRLVLTWFEAAAAERSVASGRLDLDSLAWELDLEAAGWSVGPMVEGATIGVSARGEAGSVESWRAALETGEVTALASGAYNPTDPEPVVASVVIGAGDPPGPADEDEAQAAARAARAADDPPVEGLARLLQMERNASLELELRGTLDPLRLAGVSVLRAQPITFDAPAEELTLAGRAELEGGELRITSDAFPAFDGACTLRIAATRREGVVVAVDCSDLSLESLASFAGIGLDMSGQAAAKLRAHWPREQRSQMVVEGLWEAHDLALGPLMADEARGEIEIAEGDVRLRQVLVSRGEGRLSGSLDTDIATWRQVWVDLESDAYQVGVGDADLAITGNVEGRLNLAEWTGAAGAHVGIGIRRAGADVGWIEAQAALDGRLVTVDRLAGQVGGGEVTGWATVPLDEWTASRAALRVEGLDPAAVAPELEQAQGRLIGSIAAEPARNPNAHAPLRIAGMFTLEEGAFRGLTIGAIGLEGFVGEQRAVLDSAKVEVAGGSLEVWGSTNDHDGDRYIQLSGEASDMDLDLLVHALAPEAERYPGRISGTFGGAGYLGARDRLFGEARVQVRNADLLNLPLIAELHEVMAIGGGGRGEGEAVARLEGPSLRIPEAGYFNSGTEVRMSLHMADVWQGGQSPIAGGAVAWLRPLADSPLPFSDLLDRLLAGVQAGGTAVRISGTVADPETREAPLKELQSLLGRALGASR